MKAVALVMGLGPEQFLKGSDSSWGFDETRYLSGEPWEIEKWKEAVAKTDADIVGFFCSTETIDGPLHEALAKMKAENKRVVLMPHERVETTYRLRLARKPLPERLEDFLWPTVDPSKLMGLVNYHGFVATNVFTSGGPVVQHRPPHEESGVLLAAKLVREGNLLIHQEKKDEAFAAYAQASLAFPLPEAFYGLGATASDSEKMLESFERGLVAAEEIMNILPWNKAFRWVLPINAVETLCRLPPDPEKARKFLRVGRREVPEAEENWCRCAEKIQEMEARQERLIVGFDAEVPYGVVEPLLEVFDSPLPELIHHHHRVYATAASTPHRDHAAMFVLPLDRRPSLDLAELAGLHRARGLIAVSEFQAEQYRRAYPFLSVDFIKVCPLGFDTKVDEDLGKFEWIAMSDVPNEVEQEIIDRAGIGDDIRGPGEDFYLERSKIFLHVPLDEPYHCETVLRAQAAGAVPVVAAVGCLPELVKGGYCIRPPVTSEAFIEATVKRIWNLLERESDRLATAEEGRRRVLAENTWEAVAPLWRKGLS